MRFVDRSVVREDERLAAALGWLGVGLGAAQLVAPGAVNWIAGIPNRPGTRALQRVTGLRELGTSAGIFGDPQPYPWLWSRVAGDAIDVTMLGLALRTRNGRRRTALAVVAVAAVTAADVMASIASARRAGRLGPDGALRVKATLTVNRPVEDVYRFWRDLENFPRFMYHVESVETLTDTRSHWVARAPAGTKVEWEAEIVEDVPGRRLSWGSVDASGIENSGRVEFRAAPRGQGTEVAVELEYKPPAGPLGSVVARLFGEEPSQQLRDDLRRLKQVLETGEVARSEGTPESAATFRQLTPRQAQPAR
jgi:uncharacterized membrane protein